MNGTLECPRQEDPYPYRDLRRGFSKHLQEAFFPPWIIGRGSMTAWEARIVGTDWAREWGRWCAATCALESPRQQYAAVLLEGRGPQTRPRPTMIRGAGPDHPWDAAAKGWLQAAPEQHVGSSGDVSSLIRAPFPPRLVLHATNVLRATEIQARGRDAATIRWQPPEAGATRLNVAHFKDRGPTYDASCPGWAIFWGPCSSCSPSTLQLRYVGSWTTAKDRGYGRRRLRTAPYWPSSTWTSQTGASAVLLSPTPPGTTRI